MALTKTHNRMLEGAFVNVKDFGSVGDGTTDDTTSIQSAITFLVNKGGGTLYFPKGAYGISSTIQIDADSIGIKMERGCAKLFALSGFTTGSMLLLGRSAMRFDRAMYDVYVDGNNQSTVSNGIELDGASGCVFYGARGNNIPNGTFIRCHAVNNAVFDNSFFAPQALNVLHGFKFYGPTFDEFCTRNYIVGGRLKGTGTSSGGIGIEIGNSLNVYSATNVVGHMDIETFETGIFIGADKTTIFAYTEQNGNGMEIRSGVSDTVFNFAEANDGLIDNGINTRGAFVTSGFYGLPENITAAAGAGSAVTGSPALTNASEATCWALDSASSEDVGFSFTIPKGWKKADIQIRWTNLGAGSGDVVFDLFANNRNDGETIGSSVVSQTKTITAPAQNVLSIDTVSTSSISVSENRLFTVRVRRDGGNVSDTLGNDCGLIAVNLIKAE